MEKIVKFLVQGSAKTPYRVSFWKEEGSKDLHSACTCPAGKKGMYCKHRFQVIEGDISNVIDYSEEDMAILHDMLMNSDIGKFYEIFSKAKIGKAISSIYYDPNLKSSFTRCSKKKSELKTFEDIKELKNQDLIILKTSYGIYFLTLHKQLVYQCMIDFSELEKLEIYPLVQNYFYTNSKYYHDCYNFYKKSNMKDIIEKMKEFMR